jgi:methylated-DNA-protein-cysteine methyltransferase-like protein
MTQFEKTVRRVVRAIPRGTTLSYGQVALFANKPGAARAVVRALHALDAIPWWRVIRSDGKMAPQIALQQARKLRAEGVKVEGRRVQGVKLSRTKRG